MKRFDPKEGDKGYAIHPDLDQWVEVTYRRQWLRYRPDDVDVFTIVGVYEPSGEVLLIPPQATPDIAAAIKAKAVAAATAAAQA